MQKKLVVSALALGGSLGLLLGVQKVRLIQAELECERKLANISAAQLPERLTIPAITDGTLYQGLPNAAPDSSAPRPPRMPDPNVGWTGKVPVTVTWDSNGKKRSYLLESLHKNALHFTETENPLRVTCSTGGADELVVEFDKDKQPVRYAFEINGYRYYDLDGDGMFDYVANEKTQKARVLMDYKYVNVAFDKETPTTLVAKDLGGRALAFAKGKWVTK